MKVLKMNNKGSTPLVEVIIFGLIIGILCLVWLNKHIIGNKQIIDLKQEFNVAYVLGDSNKFNRVEIKKWNDYQNSDSIQIITTDGKTIYTHLCNVILTKETLNKKDKN